MKKLEEGQIVNMEIVHHEDLVGAVNITVGGNEVRDLFEVHLDASSVPTVLLKGYLRDEDGRLYTELKSSEYGEPPQEEVASKERKFIVSGRIELTLEEEITDD